MAVAILRHTPLESGHRALRVGFHLCRLAGRWAQIIEMQLRDGLVRLRDVPPLVDELASRQPISQAASSKQPQNTAVPTFCPEPTPFVASRSGVLHRVASSYQAFGNCLFGAMP